MQENKLVDREQINLVEFAEQNPDVDNETLITDGIQNVIEPIKVDLASSDAKRLERFAENNDFKTKGEAAARLIVDGLDQSGD